MQNVPNRLTSLMFVFAVLAAFAAGKWSANRGNVQAGVLPYPPATDAVDDEPRNRDDGEYERRRARGERDDDGEEPRVRRGREDREPQVQRSRDNDDEDAGEEGDEQRERDEAEIEDRERPLGEWDELELHERHLAIEHMELEIRHLRHESVIDRLRLAEEPGASAAYAVMQLSDFLDEETAIDNLLDLTYEVESGAIRRMIRMKLVELLARRGEQSEAAKQMRALILDRRAR
jgi:hypothetical protein